MKLRLHDMKWPDVEEVLNNRHVLLIPIGSVEQHARHLPLSVDSRCAGYIAERAAETVMKDQHGHVVVAPTIHYTEVTTFASYPGTIGITLDTEQRLIADIARSTIQQGFQNILFINGHMSNVIPMNFALRQVNIEYPDAGLYAVSWWDLGSDVTREVRKSTSGLHAEEIETSVSLVIQPENVSIRDAEKNILRFSLSEKWVSPDFYGPKRIFYHSRKKLPVHGTESGVAGDATVATRETGEKILDAVISDLAEIIVEILMIPETAA